MKILSAREGIPPCDSVLGLAFPGEDPLTRDNYNQLLDTGHVLPRTVELRKPKWILDLGANYGYSTWELAKKYPTAQIVAVEMDEGNCLTLRKNVHQFGERVTVINAAVMAAPGTVEYDGLAPTTYTTLAVSSKEAEAVTIDQIMEEVGCPYWDYIKMDIEGSEWSILRGKMPWLKQTHVIKIEVHEHYPDNGLVPNPEDYVAKVGTLDEVKNVMASHGFKLVDEDYIILTFQWQGEPLPMGHGVRREDGRLPNVMGHRVIHESAPRGIPTKRYPKQCDNRYAHQNHDQCPGRSFDQT
jgi:FkbM family methyltransferase